MKKRAIYLVRGSATVLGGKGQAGIRSPQVNSQLYRRQSLDVSGNKHWRCPKNPQNDYMPFPRTEKPYWKRARSAAEILNAIKPREPASRRVSPTSEPVRSEYMPVQMIPEGEDPETGLECTLDVTGAKPQTEDWHAW